MLEPPISVVFDESFLNDWDVWIVFRFLVIHYAEANCWAENWLRTSFLRWHTVTTWMNLSCSQWPKYCEKHFAFFQMIGATVSFTNAPCLIHKPVKQKCVNIYNPNHKPVKPQLLGLSQFKCYWNSTASF